MNYYFNTTRETGRELKKACEKVENQDIRVFSIVYDAKEKGVTSGEVYSKFVKMANHYALVPPISSIRRSLSTLTERGVIEKTVEKRIGIYGRNNYVYKISK